MFPNLLVLIQDNNLHVGAEFGPDPNTILFYSLF